MNCEHTKKIHEMDERIDEMDERIEALERVVKSLCVMFSKIWRSGND